MTPCPSQVVLEALLADRLSEPVEAVLEAHVSGCTTCQQTLETMTAGTRTPQNEGTATEDKGFLADSGVLSAIIQEPAAKSADGVLSWVKPSAAPVLPKLPGYDVLAEVGRGGMGVVYRARQVMLNRIVALKMLRSGGQADMADRARFQSEAEAVARLQHPNIVQIYETGMSADQPFFALEFVEGGSLAKHLDQTPQQPRQAAELVETLARAIQAAHENGIVHRDLKPSNILLAVGSGQRAVGSEDKKHFVPPTAHCPLPTVPKITDFGLAKLLDRQSDLTGSRDILGTPSYMAPEQAKGGSREQGPGVDIYALGAILYEMLTGRPPFRAESPYDTVLQVVQDEPMPPSQLQRKVPRDLEIICLKCLQKEPKQRYASALALADDLRRFLNGEPIVARPVSPWRRCIKLAQRRPLLATLIAVELFLAVVAVVGLTQAIAQTGKVARLEAERVRQEIALRQLAEQERQRAERLSARTLLDLGISQCEKGNFDHGMLHLVNALTLAVQLPDPDLEYAARANLACWRPYYLRVTSLLQHGDWVWAVAFSPDGRLAVTGSKDQTARVWDVVTGEPVTPPLPHSAPVWAVAFSPDSKVVLTGSGSSNRGEARLWDAATGKPISQPLVHEKQVNTVAFAPDGNTFLTYCTSQVRIWDSATRMPVGNPIRHSGAIRFALFSPDGKTILTGSDDRTAQMWRSDTGAIWGAPIQHPGPVTAGAFSPDGKKLLTACDLSESDVNKQRRINGAARLWRTDTGEAISQPLVHQGPVMAVAFSPDGKIGLTGGIVPGNPASPKKRGEARQWRADLDDPQIGTQIGPVLEHPEPVWSVAFSPSGQTVLTGCEDRHARLWASAGDLIATSSLHEGLVRQAVYSPDGRMILTASTSDRSAGRLWEAPPELPLTVLRMESGYLQAWALSADGRFAVIGASNGQAEVWDTTFPRRLGKPLVLPGNIWAAAFSADARTVLIGTAKPGKTGEVHFWDRVSGQHARPSLAHDSAVHAIACSSDGRFIVTGTEDGKIRLWDAVGTEPRFAISAHTNAVLTLLFSPDNQTFISGSKDGTAQIWDTATGKHLQTWPHPGWTKVGGFSPDGRLCLAASGNAAYFWIVSTGQLMASPRLVPNSLHATCIHPDGRSYYTASWTTGTVQRWDIALGKPLGPAIESKQEIGVAAAGSNNRVLLGGFRATTATVIYAPLALTDDVARIKLAVEALTGKELDNEGMIRDLTKNEWQARRQELNRQGGNPFAVPVVR